jgi:very-short-patch-repair endonuclease
LDGGQHDLAEQITHYQQRTAVLEKEGIRVLRYWDIDVIQNLDGILEDILAELNDFEVVA